MCNIILPEGVKKQLKLLPCLTSRIVAIFLHGVVAMMMDRQVRRKTKGLSNLNLKGDLVRIIEYKLLESAMPDWLCFCMCFRFWDEFVIHVVSRASIIEEKEVPVCPGSGKCFFVCVGDDWQQSSWDCGEYAGLMYSCVMSLRKPCIMLEWTDKQVNFLFKVKFLILITMLHAGCEFSRKQWK